MDVKIHQRPVDSGNTISSFYEAFIRSFTQRTIYITADSAVSTLITRFKHLLNMSFEDFSMVPDGNLLVVNVEANDADSILGHARRLFHPSKPGVMYLDGIDTTEAFLTKILDEVKPLIDEVNVVTGFDNPDMDAEIVKETFTSFVMPRELDTMRATVKALRVLYKK